VRIEVLTAVRMTMFFWAVTPFRLVGRYTQMDAGSCRKYTLFL
jgi:hypothetical protein